MDDKEKPIDTTNEYSIHVGENLPNHSSATRGQAKFVRVTTDIGGNFPLFRTKQSAYRFMGWLYRYVNEIDLPDEEGAHSYDSVRDAILKQK